ncbi:MAG: HAD family hydrolase [Ignavibacteria bacterium]|nr:HAD family hydrolase [Ignavibacteria bacterium]
MKNYKYKHVIWDWNGTLLDDSWLCVEIMSGMLKKRNMMDFDAETYQRLFDFPVRDYYQTLGFDFEKESFEIVGTEFIIEYEKRKYECGLYPSAISILNQIRDSGISQSILSAYKQDTLETLVDHFGLRNFFLKVVGLNDHYAKSKLDNGKLLIEGLGIDTKQIILVGDTKHDHEVASSIGTDCILVFGGHQSKERLRTCGVPVYEKLEDILSHIVEGKNLSRSCPKQ